MTMVARKLLFFLGFCISFTTSLAALPSFETTNKKAGNGDAYNTISKSDKRIYIIVGASCGGFIILAAIIIGAALGIYRYTRIRKRNKVRNEIISYFRSIRHSEVCRHCWGRQANVYCEDCSKHYFCILCSDHVHNIYTDKRCCTYCRKSLGKHRINNVSWPTEQQSQGSPLIKSVDDPLQSETIMAAQGVSNKSGSVSDGQDLNSSKGNISINCSEKESLLNKNKKRKQYNTQKQIKPTPTLTDSYTTLNSLLGYENEDDDD